MADIALFQKVIRDLWTHCPRDLMNGIQKNAEIDLTEMNINTPLRMAHFLAQISHESDGGVITHESLYYTHAARIAAVWPSRFTVESAQAYVMNEKKLASRVYNGRMGNIPGTDDGYNFRGRGLLQITGRDSYSRAGKALGYDLENDPDLAIAPGNALRIAAWEFKSLGCLPYCDDDNILMVTKRVNGGTNGLSSRREWYSRIAPRIGV
jgi:putative chitinase